MWNWFADKFVPFLKGAFETLFSVIGGWFGVAWSFVLMVWAIVAGILTLIVWAFGKLTQLVSTLDIEALASLKPMAGMLHFYVFINRLVPLDEAFAGVGVCFTLWLTITLIRWIKSFLPSVSN